MILLLLETSMLQVERGEFTPPPANKRCAPLIITEIHWTQHESNDGEWRQCFYCRSACSSLGTEPAVLTLGRWANCLLVVPASQWHLVTITTVARKHTVLKAPRCLQINSKSDQDLRVETVSVWIFDVLCISLSRLKGWTYAQDSSRLQSH